MRTADILAFASGALTEGKNVVRSALIVLAMAIGVGGVVTLSWLGDAARSFVVREFEALGTGMLIVFPGRSETTGGRPPLFGTTPRDLTLDDALALERLPSVARVAPLVLGDVEASVGRLSREATVLGSTPELFPIRHLRMASGRVWSGAPDRAQAVCVLGATIRRELFGNAPALGRWLRLGDRRYRVVGILASEGRSIGLDLEEIVVIPVASAQALFDSPGLFRCLVEVRDRALLDRTIERVREAIRRRHDGEDDVTIISQESVVGAFDQILGILTFAVAGIAAISLLVAGILIMNVMIVSVVQRREEIGLLQALGSSPRRITMLFLAESALLSAVGAGAGLALGQALSWVGHRIYPDLHAGAPWWSMVAAGVLAVVCGVVFGVAPARQAAGLDPVEALSRRH